MATSDKWPVPPPDRDRVPATNAELTEAVCAVGDLLDRVAVLEGQLRDLASVSAVAELFGDPPERTRSEQWACEQAHRHRTGFASVEWLGIRFVLKREACICRVRIVRDGESSDPRWPGWSIAHEARCPWQSTAEHERAERERAAKAAVARRKLLEQDPGLRFIPSRRRLKGD